MRKKFFLLALILFLEISCGKKGALEVPQNYKRPNFDNLIEEN
jgi:predicted small lipoprotein YifL